MADSTPSPYQPRSSQKPLDQVRDAIRLRHCSYRAEESCVNLRHILPRNHARNLIADDLQAVVKRICRDQPAGGVLDFHPHIAWRAGSVVDLQFVCRVADFWGAENKLVARMQSEITNTVASQVTRFYRDADGNLLKKSDGAGTVMIVRVHFGHITTTNECTSDYLFGGQRVAMRTSGDVPHIIHELESHMLQTVLDLLNPHQAAASVT